MLRPSFVDAIEAKRFQLYAALLVICKVNVGLLDVQ